ncbi:MAG: class I SAM-dependent methyltransferase [Candidatus Saccharimonadales bacterium]
MDFNKFLEISRRLSEWLSFDDKIFFHETIAPIAKPYDRTEYILKLCKGKRVLHFGFTDSPFTEERIKNNEILHLRIKGGAKDLWGTDIDKAAIKKYSGITGDKNVFPLDISKPVKNVGRYNKNFDLIVFGEVLEHVLNPGIALNNLARICASNRAQLLLTTPNAFNIGGFLAAWNGNEIVHPEHYYYFSPVTLRQLLNDTGFKDIKIYLYASEATQDTKGITAPGLIAICKPR